MNILVKYIILINMLLFIKTTYSQQNNIIYNSINDQLQLLLDDSYHAGEIVDVNKELGIDLRNRRGAIFFTAIPMILKKVMLLEFIKMEK